MGIQTASIAVYPVTRFDARADSFWIGPLNDLLALHAWLGTPHKRSFYMYNNMLHRFSLFKKNITGAIRLHNAQAEKWNYLLGLMQEEFRQEQDGAENVLRSYLNVLLFDLERQTLPNGSESAGAKEEKLIRFEQLLEEHYLQQKKPSWYAGALHISANYLNKLCREQRGQTSGEIIRQRIALEGQRLLHHTSLSVAGIAYKLGFDNPSYFVTFFKKQTATTPESFRKCHA